MANKTMYKKLMEEKMSKYEALAPKILTNKYQSTNKVRKLMEAKTKTTVNWYILHRTLTKPEREGKI